MPVPVLPEDAEKIERGLHCTRCRKGGQFPRLIVDPATGRRHNFFECVACGFPNWSELKDKVGGPR